MASFNALSGTKVDEEEEGSFVGLNDDEKDCRSLSKKTLPLLSLEINAVEFGGEYIMFEHSRPQS